MHFKPFARFKDRAKVSLSLSLSSTMETVISTSSRSLHWHTQPHHRPIIRDRGDGELSAHIFHAFAHIAQSISTLHSVHFLWPTAVILDFDGEVAVFEDEPDPGLRSLRVFYNIGDGFFEGEEHIVAEFRGNGDIRKLSGDVEAVSQTCSCEIILGIFAGIADQA